MARFTEESRCAVVLTWPPAGVLLTVLLALLPVIPAAGAERASGERTAETHALLLNGGKSPGSNAQSHLHHLQDMVRELRGRGLPAERIHIFSSDGTDPGKDMAVRAMKDPRFWLVERTREGRALHRTELTDTPWEMPNVRAARMSELEPWFEKRAGDLLPGDTLLVFVTDHGTRNKEDPDNGFISLWEEDLSVREFRRLLSMLQPGVRVVQVMSQCYSGGFSASMFPEGSLVPDGDVCGFYSTRADRKAYGCYPEGRDRDRIGHAFRMIDALSRHQSVGDAHLEVLLTDTTPDVPLRTSDLFLEEALREEARQRDSTFEALVDALLAEAWRDRGAWEPEIRLIDGVAHAYDTFSPRNLSELGTAIEELEGLSNQLETYANRWRSALDDLRKENVRLFLEGRPDWKDKLARDALKDLGAAERAGLLDAFLTDVRAFTKARTEIWERLNQLRENRTEAQAAHFRVETRLAAQLRMRTILVRVAGSHFLAAGEGDDQRSVALASLEECEAFMPGRSRGAGTAPGLVARQVLPPYEKDREAVENILPSWLGVRFRTASKEMREELDLEGGAVQIQQVYEESPAGLGGIEPGDIVLGPPGEPFLEPNQIREWTMTSLRGKPLALELLRGARRMEVEVSLEPYPIKLPDLPKPPVAGDLAPTLGSLEVLRGPEGPLEVTGRRHLLFFWATWCLPCKSSVPELMEWSAAAGVPVVALTDEYAATVRSFLERREEPFPDLVATDTLRESFRRYGVSGTPTFVLVGEDGRIEWRKTGYRPDEGLGIGGSGEEPDGGREPPAAD